MTTSAGEIPTLDAVDTLLHVAAHACLAGGHRLAWCVDIKSVVSSGEIDWSKVIDRGRHMGLALPVSVMLARTHSLLGLDLPPHLPSALGCRATWPEVRRRILSGRTVMESTRDGGASTGALVRAVGGHVYAVPAFEPRHRREGHPQLFGRRLQITTRYLYQPVADP